MQVDSVRASVASLMGQARKDLETLVEIPSVADERLYPVQNCQQAANWVADAFRAAGIESVTLEPTSDGSLAVVGHHQGPEGAPTVLLYGHYDVQPPLDAQAWQTPPFRLTEKDGRWYGRGSADCKGNLVAHLTALRALQADGAELPVSVRILIEGSEEQGTGGLEDYVSRTAGSLTSDVLIVADTGNAKLGLPTVTTSLRGLANVVVTVETMDHEVHSGMFGGAAPDALAALIAILASLRDSRGNTTIDGLDAAGTWPGVPYDPTQFRSDAGVLEGVDLLGDGSVADQVWSRPAITVLGIDAPTVVASAAAIQPKAAARLNLRVPPGMDAAKAQQKLTEHLLAHAPWGAKVTVADDGRGQPYRAATAGPAYQVLAKAMEAAFGQPMVQSGQGGSIPLCNVLQQVYPQAELVMIGVEEPLCRIHATNESVAPQDIEHLAVAEALFLAWLPEQAR